MHTGAMCARNGHAFRLRSRAPIMRTMEKVNVISVDPGIKTLGEINVSQFRLADISRSLSAPSRKTDTLHELTDFILGTGISTRRMSRRLACVRIILASLGVAVSIWEYSCGQPELCIACAVLSCSMLLGFLLRPVCTLGVATVAICLCDGSFQTLSADIFGILSAASAFFCIAILGPGRYSADYKLAKMIRGSRKSERKEPAETTEFDYRAYSVMDRRLR